MNENLKTVKISLILPSSCNLNAYPTCFALFAAKTWKVNDSKNYIFDTNDDIGFVSNAYLIFFLGTEMSRNETSNGLQP